MYVLCTSLLPDGRISGQKTQNRPQKKVYGSRKLVGRFFFKLAEFFGLIGRTSKSGSGNSVRVRAYEVLLKLEISIQWFHQSYSTTQSLITPKGPKSHRLSHVVGH